MLCCRIAAGGFALLAASVVNASAQSCLLPWACEKPPSVERVERKTTFQSTNVKNDSPSQKGSLRIARPDPRRVSVADSHQRLALRHLSQPAKMVDQDKDESSLEPRQGQQQENQNTANQILFDEFLRWRVHQVIVEPE